MEPTLGSHPQGASFAGSPRARRYSALGEEAAEPFLGRGNAQDDVESVSSERARGKGLEHTLDRIGFGEVAVLRRAGDGRLIIYLDSAGPYQWRLLVLCGCGWLSDNASLQSVA